MNIKVTPLKLPDNDQNKEEKKLMSCRSGAKQYQILQVLEKKKS